MSENKELHTRQELIVELYNHTIRQLCRGNIGDFKDGIAMINTLATLVTSPNFPATFTTRDIGLLACETIAICEKEDYIVELEDGLRARIAELEAAQRWIPVEEKLPEKYRDDETGELIPFLACTKKAELPFRALYDGTQWGDGMFPVEVTHWKPLPKLPKESEE